MALVGTNAQAVLADYVEVVALVAPSEVPRVVPTDVDDDHVIAAAVAGGAEIIVSGDSDLLGIGSHQGVAIVAATVALGQLAPDT